MHSSCLPLPVYSHLLTKEFGIEIPDAEADEIQTVQQGKAKRFAASWTQRFLIILPAIDYISKTPEGQKLSLCLLHEV